MLQACCVGRAVLRNLFHKFGQTQPSLFPDEVKTTTSFIYNLDADNVHGKYFQGDGGTTSYLQL